MRETRHKLRHFLAEIARVSYVEIWWTPQLPIIYINNPKAGCSTIKHTLKSAQAGEYIRKGTKFERIEDPHHSDDCLIHNDFRTAYRLGVSAFRQRSVISCVRNPYTRALSGYLDKLKGQDLTHRRNLRKYEAGSFEEFLLNSGERRAKTVNPHFRPQHINLDFPNVDYEAIFYLENLSAFSQFLSRLSPDYFVKTYAPHARSAANKLRDHYTDRAIQLVQEIYDKDFSHFRYSRDLDDAAIAPGAFISRNQLIFNGEDVSCISSLPGNVQPRNAFMSALFFHKLIEMRLI